MGRFDVSADLLIPAPMERVYAVLSDPRNVVRYERHVERIEAMNQGDGPRRRLVRVALRIGGIRFVNLYRYHYRPPRVYAGVQADGGLLTGCFSFRLGSVPGGTRVRHAEGLRSRWPWLAEAAGAVYYRLLNRDGLREELRRLRELVLAGGE